MFGLDRQSYYRKIKRIKKRQNLAEQVVELVQKIRVYQKRIGTRKLYYLLENELKSLKIGRDKFFDILRANHLLIKPKKIIIPQQCLFIDLENILISSKN